MKSELFSSYKLRDVTFKNRIFLSPMCQYSAQNGVPNDWHMVHLGARAIGGAALIIAEATGITPEGRISVGCLGIWNDIQQDAFKRINAFIKSQGAIPGIQLIHAGRKASTDVSWKGGKSISKEEGGWETLGPSAVTYSSSYPAPKEMSREDIYDHVDHFVKAAQRSVAAGFEVIELHMAHGYLLHQFLSPISNVRSDEFGGALENRMRFPLMVAKAVREALPENLPLFVRISATDWAEGGWNENESVILCEEFKKIGVDFMDISTGGNVHGVTIPVGPLYQVPFAKLIKAKTGMPTGAVGLITKPSEAEALIANGDVDAVLIGRELLRDPNWPLKAAKTLGADVEIPPQYSRAF